MKIPKGSHVLMLTHFYKRASEGGLPQQDVRDYLIPKVKKLVYIEHPFIYADDKRSSASVYENGILTKQIFTYARSEPEALHYCLDFFVNLYLLARVGFVYDLCIALDCLNTANMLPFRFMRCIKKIIFYSIDYVPQRFPNALLNAIYHAVEKVACAYADTVWILSPILNTSRRAHGIKRIAHSVVLPMGAHLERIQPLAIKQIHKHQIIFVGILLEKQGLQLVLQSLPGVTGKVKDAQLIIVGKGEYAQPLKNLARKLHLGNHVKFLGFVEKHTAVEKLLCESAIGVAPYTPMSDSYTYYTDPGKPKQYLGCGLPVIITDVPPIARVIATNKAGVMVDYTVRSMEHALLKLLTDDTFYANLRQHAIRLSKKYDTNTLIRTALAKSR